MARSKRLVQGVEIWVPDGETLVFGGGAYGHHAELASVSERMRFRYGEGLPGAVWSNGRALVWKELGMYFMRAKLAAAAGIDAAAGCPVFRGDTLIAVLTLLLGKHAEAPCCLEVWDCDDQAGVLRHNRSHYVHCPDFERLSKLIQFPKGTGLPGRSWMGGGVEVMEDVRRSSSFVRAGLASRSGLQRGLALPVYRGRNTAQVLTLFDAERGSLLRGVEVYRPEPEGVSAELCFDWSDRISRSSPASEARGTRCAESAIRSGLPAVSNGASGNALISSPDTDDDIGLALPIHDGSKLRQVVYLRF